MFNGIFHIPEPANEPGLQYAPGSPERTELGAKLKEMLGGQAEVPMIIGGKEVRNGKLADRKKGSSNTLVGVHNNDPFRGTS